VEQYPVLTKNIVVIRIRTGAGWVIIVSFYFEPISSPGPYLEHLAKITDQLGADSVILREGV
jgi:hypothetical protein